MVYENVMRVAWIAGALLSTAPADAQRAAREMHDKFIRAGAAAIAP